MAQHLDEERKVVIRHLEKLVDRERVEGQSIQRDLLEEIEHMKSKLAANSANVEQLEKHIAGLCNERNIIKTEVRMGGS